MTAINLLDDRKAAIHLLRSGSSPQQVAEALNRSVRWVYKWQERFAQEGWAGLHGYSKAPKHHGRRLSECVRQGIIQTRSRLEAEAAEGQHLKYVGATAVQAQWPPDSEAPQPSTASIERVMRRAGLSRPKPDRSTPQVIYPRLRPDQPHQLIQVDIVPHYLRGGEAVACFNALDLVSRYPTGQAYSRRRADEAVTFLIHVWQEFDLPRYTQVDNEGCFSGGFTHQGVLGQVVRLALWVGTELVFIPIRHPESNGSIERFHQDYDDHVWSVVLADRTQVNQAGQNFFAQYRQSRHHTALAGSSPMEVHHRLPPQPLPVDFKLPPGKLPLTPGQIHFIRRVSEAGTVSVLNLPWSVPNPDPLHGVWITLTFSLTGARLHIYDAAPDVQQRVCLATYPFPLKEAVQPKPVVQAEPSHLLLWPLEMFTRSANSAFEVAANFFRVSV